MWHKISGKIARQATSYWRDTDQRQKKTQFGCSRIYISPLKIVSRIFISNFANLVNPRCTLLWMTSSMTSYENSFSGQTTLEVYCINKQFWNIFLVSCSWLESQNTMQAVIIDPILAHSLPRNPFDWEQHRCYDSSAAYTHTAAIAQALWISKIKSSEISG